MAVKTVAWQKGDGYITLTYTGMGNAPISVTSDANELYEDREQTVQIVTTNGSPQRAVNLLIKQKGKTYPVGTAFNYEYTGSVQQVTLPKGRYKLQCWGAQGGNVSGSYSAQGSKGGYSEGEITLTETTDIYIFVGGKGTDSSTSSTSGTANGGWNGGGSSVRRSTYNSGNTYGISYPRPGGGGTDMCLVTSSMNYSSGRTNRSSTSLLSRFIVAGGGAGASARYTEETIEVPAGEDWQTFKTGSGKTGNYTTGDAKLYQAYVNINDVEAGKEYRVSLESTSDAFLWNIAEYDGTNWNYYSSSFMAKDGCSYSMDIRSYTMYAPYTYTVEVYDTIYEESTETSSGTSNANQQGGGTSGRGNSPGTPSSAGNGGEFGLGANQTTSNYRYDAGAGGGGWYGGGTDHSDTSTSYVNRSGGGSGFVNTSANASNRPSGYTGLQLDSGSTQDGSTSFPSPSGGNETGHSGNGYAKITVLEQH